MDWTGGTRRLYASKGQKNAIVQKQKNYFAKARANGAGQSAGLPPDIIEIRSKKRPRPSTKDSGYSRYSRSVSSARSSRATSRSSHAANGPDKRVKAKTPLAISSRNRKRHSPHHGSHASAEGTTKATLSDEDRLLFANRQRLLASKDWLGLELTKPLQMTFPSEHKGRIGKRRKVSKPLLQRNFCEERRQATPPFQAEPLMSGGLQSDDIQVKVGTDAFASQTQPSRASYASMSTSVRQPSTEFGPISEESMLLDVEDGGLGPDEPDFSHIQEYLDRRQMRPRLSVEEDPDMMSSWVVAQGDDQSWHQDRDRLLAEIQPGQSHRLADPPLHAALHDPPTLSSRHSSMDRSCHAASLPHFSNVSTDWLRRGDPVFIESAQPEILDSPVRDTTSDDERAWQRAMGVERSPSPHASMAALRSDSLHETQSNASYWPLPKGEPVFTDYRERPATQDAFLQHEDRAYMSATEAANQFYAPSTKPSDRRSAVVHHPQVVEKRLNVVARSSPSRVAQDEEVRSDVMRDEEAKDEALWRSFIIGSDQSCSSEEPTRGRAWAADMMEEIPPASPSISQQARSDRVTIGDITYAAPSSTDMTARGPRSYTESKTFYDNTSLLGHATTAAANDSFDDERDSPGATGILDDIEDGCSTAPRPSVKSNVHVTTSVLSARRFKSSRRPLDRSQPVIAPATRFLPRDRRQSRKERSVYDIMSTSGS